MKKLLLVVLLFQTSFAFSQAAGTEGDYLKTFKVHGYVNGVRLDSIDAGYAKFGRHAESIFFEYGQNVKIKDMIITNKEGLPLFFPGFDYYLFKINFFYYNGWKLATQSQETYNLLEKRNKE